MRIKLEWLNELIDISDISIEKIVNILSLHSIEVENVEKLVKATNLFVGYVREKKSHPDSNHLSVCMVEVKDEVLQIVCGASNVLAGQYVIVAVNGAKLPNGLEIKKSIIRGIESNGMICSLEELGLEKKYISDEYQNGIFYFKEKVIVGTDALHALNLHDSVIELGLTPNRSDLLSMIGVAIEVGAVFNRPLKPLMYNVIEDERKSTDYIEVINNTSDCLAYYAQVFQNISIKQSPRWLISRLIAFGIRPINNVVDITNYIMALYGQPLHAFDYEKLGSKILVRKAHEFEEMKTLDSIERTLHTNDVLITNGTKPVAIAGVMGGLDTEITSETKTIVIEAAVFSPSSVRQTSQRLGLRSDSSIRFEKGVDVNRVKEALSYTCYLLQTYANATVLKNPAFAGIKEVKPTTIQITENDVARLLGIEISKQEIIEIINRLGFVVSSNLIVQVPNRRSDVKIKVDLIEEIGRVYGYEKLPCTLPLSSLTGSLTNTQRIRRNIKNVLTGLGLNEVITYSLVSEEDLKVFSYNHEENSQPIELLMPLSLDRKYLRKSLAMSLITNAKYCYSRKNKDLAIFEIGKGYYQKDNYQEEEFLSILMSNQFSNTLWKGNVEKVDFYLLKGIIEVLFNKLGLNVEYRPLSKACKELHLNRSASIYLNNENIGFIGCIHPKFASVNSLDEIYVLEIKLKTILNNKITITKYQEISKVPSVERDIAIVVDQSVLAGDLISLIKELDQDTLSDVKVFDVYTGDKVDKNQKSIAIKLMFTSYETLTDDVISNKVSNIVKALTLKFNAILRS